MKIIRAIPELLDHANLCHDSDHLSSLILYNSPAMAHRGVRLATQLERQRRLFIYATRTFDLNWLSQPDKAELATAEALMSDLIIVAINPSESLPTSCNRWFWNWARTRAESQRRRDLSQGTGGRTSMRSHGLLMLLQDDFPDPDLLHWDFLRHIAWLSEMEFRFQHDQDFETFEALSGPPQPLGATSRLQN